ncbi:hypothetical protein BH10ACI3_BH10ACI3_01490 [soil metagenome]
MGWSLHRIKEKRFLRYGWAFLMFGLTIGLSVLLSNLGIKINLTIPVVFALVATAWLGGRGPGFLISVLFEATTIIYTPIPPDSSIPKAVFGYFSVFLLYIFLVVVLTSLQNARDGLRGRARQQGAVAEFGQNALSGVPLAELLQQAVEISREVLGVDYTAIAEISPDKNILVFSAASGWPEDVIGHELDIGSPRSVARQVLANEQAVTFEDLYEESGFELSELLKHHGARSGICARISGGDGYVGIFGAVQKRPRKFTDDDVHFLQSLANIISEASVRLTAEEDLRKQRAWLETTLTSIGDGVIATDPAGAITFMNPVAEELTGWDERSAYGRPLEKVFRIYNEHTHAPIVDPVQQVLATGRVVGMHNHTILRSKEGKEIPVEDSASPIKEGDAIKGVVLVFSDVTQRKRADAMSGTLAAIVRSSNDAIVSKNLDGMIQSWNKGAERLFGYTSDEIVGKSVTILIPDERINEEPAILERIKRGESVNPYETVRRRKDGTLVDISLTISPVFDSDGNIIGASKIARDITERKLADRALRERETMVRIVEAQESERHRIARDLHDNLGQKITAHRLRMESLAQFGSEDPELTRSIANLQESAADIDRGINFLSWELRPTELEDLGLIDALRSFVREWSKYHDIRAEFQIVGEGTFTRIPAKIETHVYRIVQEALNNILKHADAQNVSVMLQNRDRQLILSIEDDGCGFDHSPGASDLTPVTSGLVAMHERASILNGTFEIDTTPGSGTTLYARIPLDGKPIPTSDPIFQ